MPKVTRRSFVSTLSAAPWLPVSALTRTTRPAIDVGQSTDSRYVFFDDVEGRFIEAACARLISVHPACPGAHGTEVAHYMDRQLSSAWGAGQRLLRDGDWQPGSPVKVPAPFTPATLFRRALGAINLVFESRGVAFDAVSWEAQGKFLACLQSGGIDLNGAPPSVFFDVLLRITVEGFFSHPIHGNTRDRIPWRICGFPGAHAT